MQQRAMTPAEAAQIAGLLNDRNELDQHLTEHSVLEDAQNYRYEVIDGTVIACAASRRVQWYQWEVYHVSVVRGLEKAGHAWRLYNQVVTRAKENGARVLQCTIREGNADSERFFARQGFRKVSRFLNSRTGNVVGVWQDVLSPPKDTQQP
jgi:L-amino acid N-acyltransferase YncA